MFSLVGFHVFPLRVSCFPSWGFMFSLSLVLAEPPLPDSLLHGAARQGSHRQRLMANGLVTNIEGRYLPCAPLHFKRQGRHFVHVNRASRNMTTPIVSPNMTSPILKDTG